MRLAALATLALLLAPAALADHVYSHRYIVEGRVVGADGLPLPGREVTLRAHGEDLLDACREGPHQSITDEWGDYRFCFHHHALRPGSRVTVSAANASATKPIDLTFRKQFVPLRDANETGVAPPGWETSHRLSGRAWRAGPVELEGVSVFGTAVIGLPVNVTVTTAEGVETVFRTTTDGYGDFDLALESVVDAANVTVALEAGGHYQHPKLNATFHRAYEPVFIATRLDDLVKEGGTQPFAVSGGASAQPPGSATPRIEPVFLIAIGLALIAAIVLSKRRTS